ncbi:membrane protein insertase YidC [Adhaeribacter aerolatus]|uniref:Membrane protein insertase YidC n=1 Tax=Adhaeribacter aerolatus TaxID=670289 RepID=A0A512B4L7_9BACT|nr:membrane protein insertase YidC [Adhaeribacter aerolatus]GEO06900.1 membrane protein insertase YidC [Adhaeribacter aerolatus]
MDKNQAIGLVLISVMLIVYMTFFSPEKPKEQPKPKATPTATVKPSQTPVSGPVDSVQQAQQRAALGAFGNVATGTAQKKVLENQNLKITFDSKGGQVDEVLLKKYKTWNKKPLILFDQTSSSTEISFRTQDNRVIKLSDLYFQAQPVKTINTKQGQSQVLAYRAELATNQYIEQVYTLPADSYLVDYKLNFAGLNDLVANAPLQFTWNDQLKKVEKDLNQNRERSRLNYMTAAEDFDHIAGSADEPEVATVEEPLKWVANKQNFFTAAILADNSFTKGTFKASFSALDTTEVKTFSSQLQIPAQDVLAGKGDFSFYFGPNDYQILKQLPADFQKNLDLGWGVFAWVNKLIVIPIFNFLEHYFTNYGIIIILLVVFIKLLLTPLTYKSYLSMAKMKVLKPEIDAIKEKHPDDMQKTQQETMKLYSTMGVNPMSGCVPMLLQIPILFALLNFFPNSIELRQESFLWAHDLSTYDVFARLPFTIPFYGNHISMFTVLMTLSTILYTWSNNQMTTIQGPMKFYSYLMPFMIMFVVNSFAAGLSFYYFVSNIVTFIQQAIIRRFVDDNKIRAKLEENKIKNKDKKPGGFQKRLQDAMKAAADREAQQKSAGEAPKKRKR